MLTNTQIESLKKEYYLSDEKIKIAHEVMEGKKQVAIGINNNICDRTVRRYMKDLLKKYDALHEMYPEKYPERIK